MSQHRKSTLVRQKVLDFFSDGERETFQKGSIILKPGESASSVFYLSSGFVRIVHHHEKNDAVTLHMFRPGCFFPLMNVLNERSNQFTFEALSAVSVFMQPKGLVRRFLHTHPDVLLDVASRLLSGMEGLLLRLSLQSTHTAQEKVSSVLSYMAESIGVSEPEGVRIPVLLSHKDIASWVGTTRETVSLQIAHLMRMRRIFYHGRTLFLREIR